MQSEELWEFCPNLYHVAWEGSWPSIKKYGLLSTKALLQLYEVDDMKFKSLTTKRRQHWETIKCPGKQPAVLRDQKPLTDNGLKSALTDGTEPWQWYDLLNSMVFLWPTICRLNTMLKARAYKKMRHDVLIFDTKKMVQMEEPRIRLSHMNSGCTVPFKHQRSTNIFKSIRDYDLKASIKKRGRKKAVAEICVKDRVDNIKEAFVDMISGSKNDIMNKLLNATKVD